MKQRIQVYIGGDWCTTTRYVIHEKSGARWAEYQLKDGTTGLTKNWRYVQDGRIHEQTELQA